MSGRHASVVFLCGEPRGQARRLAALPIAGDGQTVTRAWSDTIALARAHALSTYDAAYLELALREALPLASLDEKLRRAAAAVGVGLFKP